MLKKAREHAFGDDLEARRRPDARVEAHPVTDGSADILATGNRGYVRGMGKSKEAIWYVFRPGAPLVDPDTNQTLGYEAIYLGTAQLERPGEPSTVMLTTSVQEVGAGDKLVAAGKPQPITYAPHAPAKSIRGRVISIYGSPGKVGEAGPQAVISINRGARDGLEVGHVLAMYNLGVLELTLQMGGGGQLGLLADHPGGHAGVVHPERSASREQRRQRPAAR